MLYYLICIVSGFNFYKRNFVLGLDNFSIFRVC